MKLASFLLVLLVPSLALADDGAALVSRWLDAQNRGDFAAYQALYAPRFTGVRRSGPRVVRLDRAGWLKDRARMFGKPMTVGVEALQTFGSERTVEARFTQTFAQGTYRDRGTKSLVLVRDTGGLRIAREEMHDSTLDRPAAAVAPVGDFIGLALDEGVVLRDDAPASWAQGKATLALDTGLYVARRAVDDRQLPADLRGLLRTDLEVVQGDGSTCAARIARFVLSAEVFPHFGTVQAWRESNASDATVARDVEAEVGPTRTLVGLFAKPCPGARLARRRGSAPVAVAHVLDKGAERERALQALRAEPAYRAILADAKKEGAESVKGERWDDDGASEVRSLDVTIGGKRERWLSVGVARSEGCSEWSGELWTVYRLEGSRLVSLVKPGTVVLEPELATDLDGDGVPELSYVRGGNGDFGLRRALLWHLDRRQELTAAFHDCPC